MRGTSGTGLAALLTSVLATLLLTVALIPPANAEDYPDTIHSEVNFSPASSRAYVGSPSIVELPNGDYLATHAFFGSGSNRRSTVVMRSRNGGVAWEPVPDSPVEPMMWATVFVNQGDVYLMGAASEGYGDAVISRSTDNGNTWSTPVSLLKGAYHTGDTPVLVHQGRIYKTFEENLRPPAWAPNFRPLMISADVDADLTDPESWTRSNNVDKGSVLEGNPILGPDGMIWNILRYNGPRDQAWVTKLDPANPERLIDVGPLQFPHGVSFSKFFILWDRPSERYLLVGNPETSSTGLPTQRNHLDLYESKDLTSWRHVRTLVEGDDIAEWGRSVAQTAFSQPTAQIDGDDLLVVSRTAYDGAANYHDANRLSFHRYPDFRRYLDPDDELAHYSFDDADDPALDVSKAADTDADLTPTTQLVPGRVGRAINITDADTHVDLGNRLHPLLDGRRAISVSTWIRPDRLTAGEWSTILGSRISGSDAGIDLLFNGPEVRVGARGVAGETYQSETYPFESETYPFEDADGWHHLTAVWDFQNDDFRVFVDGEPRTGDGNVDFQNKTYEVDDPGEPDRIGGAPSGNSAFDGAIDEVRVFGSALKAAEVRRLAGLGIEPALESLSVNGTEVRGFNPSVEQYDVVVEPTDNAVVMADAAAGSKVGDPRRTIPLTDTPSEPIDFKVRHGREVRTYSLTVRRESTDTSLAGLRVAAGDRRSYSPADENYDIAVEEVAGEPLDLTLTEVIPLRTWDGAVADVIEQPDPADRNPVGRVRVTAEDGTVADHDVTVDVDRQLVSAQADPSVGDAPLAVSFTATPTRWVQGDATYSWDFGDGSTGSGREVTHTYERTGSFVATVTVTDSAGESDTAQVPIRVQAADRLVGHWRFEEGSGDAILDSSLYGNDGTSVAAQRVTGHDGTGSALEFNNTGGVTLDDQMGTDLDGAPAITMSGWIRPDGDPAAGQIGNWVFGTRISGGGAGAELYMLGNTLRVGGRSQPSDPYVRADYAFSSTGRWRHVAAVLDYAENDIRLFVDGVEQAPMGEAGSFASRSYQFASTSQPDSIGRNPDGAYRFDGALDDIRVHARALTSAEIAELAGAGGGTNAPRQR